MHERTIENPVTGERCTFVETSRETGGARTVADLEVSPGGGVPIHRHATHEELIEVLEGEVEVTLGGVSRRLGAGEQVRIAAGTVHRWRNPSTDRTLRFRGSLTPGHPGFELVLRVAFGLARDGQSRKSGLPRRFGDLALLAEWDPSLFVGPARVLAPLVRWLARRARTRGRAEELVRRYGGEEPPHASAQEADDVAAVEKWLTDPGSSRRTPPPRAASDPDR
jgi:quercetin dioxygenase-like cupin family protein